jgi:hypothetical protein
MCEIKLYFDEMNFKVVYDKCMQGVQSPGLPWQKQHSTRRRIFSPANGT